MNNNYIVPGFDEEKDDNLKITLHLSQDIEGCLIFYLKGYIDTYNSNIFQRRVNRAIEAGFVRLIFHCAELNYISSTGIGSFTTFLKAVKPRGGDMVLLEIQPKSYEVFQLLGFSQFFNIRDSVDQALLLFKQGNTKLQSYIFPKIFACPICTRKLKAVRSGRFRCSQCKTILAIDTTGQVLLG